MSQRPVILLAPDADGDLEALAAILAEMAIVAASVVDSDHPDLSASSEEPDATHASRSANQPAALRHLPPRVHQAAGKKRRLA